MARPTDEAKAYFDEAEKHITNAGLKLHNPKISPAERQLADLETLRGLWTLCSGLSSLATGLRATYILLEEVKASVAQIK